MTRREADTSAHGLSSAELEQEQASDLPDREAMSVIAVGVDMDPPLPIGPPEVVGPIPPTPIGPPDVVDAIQPTPIGPPDVVDAIQPTPIGSPIPVDPA